MLLKINFPEKQIKTNYWNRISRSQGKSISMLTIFPYDFATDVASLNYSNYYSGYW